MEFAWNSIVEMTKNSKKTDWRQALSHLKQTQDIKKKLITYICIFTLSFDYFPFSFDIVLDAVWSGCTG